MRLGTFRNAFVKRQGPRHIVTQFTACDEGPRLTSTPLFWSDKGQCPPRLYPVKIVMMPGRHPKPECGR